jgi:glucokinase
MDLFIGLDLGGTNLKYALGTKNGKIIKKQSRPSQADQSQNKIFENMFIAVEELKAEAEKRKDTILSIGVGSPGSINFETGQLNGKTPNLPSWANAPIKKTLEDRFDITTWADNDANIMALAEARIGAGKRFKNILCLTLGTGIGGGILINNQVLRGEHFSAAEVGHIIVEYNGKRCNCGNKGCLEAYTTAPAMVRRYKEKLQRLGLAYNMYDLNTEFIFQKATRNEGLAMETIVETCGYLGAGIASIANIIDPEVVIIGGGVSEAGDTFIKQIEESVKQYSIKSIMQNLKVVKAKMGNDAGIVGAILLAAENFSSKN